jgi:ubiquinone/menaquinone biosynthesis C-methylase UbiE
MSISFDRIAPHYDATRGFPPGVDAQVGAAFRRQSGLPTGARLVEIGVGTGRIAIPLVAQGYRYIGVDISPEMMRRLRARLPPGARLSLLRADATALPLGDESVDGSVSVHVFHLIDGWERAVAELQRVIRQGGTLAVGFNEMSEPSPSEQLREHWRDIVHELGGSTDRPGATKTQIDAVLEAAFGPPRRASLAAWQRRESLRERLDMIAARTHSDTWQLPEPILHESVKRAEQWARETYGDLEHSHTFEAQFTMLFYQKRTS